MTTSCSMNMFPRHLLYCSIFYTGLGMPYLSSLIVFNFQRWFLNGKIVVLSQTKNYIVEQMNAYNSFTTLSEEYYSDLYGNLYPYLVLSTSKMYFYHTNFYFRQCVCH